MSIIFVSKHGGEVNVSVGSLDEARLYRYIVVAKFQFQSSILYPSWFNNITMLHDVMNLSTCLHMVAIVAWSSLF